MNLDHFITFQRLAREKSFSETAVSLGISQPTVTLRIKEMEEELGKLLVRRMGQRVALTEIGEYFLSYTNRIIRILDTSKEMIPKFQFTQPELKLAATSTVSSYILPQFLTHWYTQFPETNITLSSAQTQDVLHMVKDRIVDIGIVRGAIFEDPLKSVTLYHDPICLVVSPNHPLATIAQSMPISIIQLHEEPIIIYRSHTWQTVNQVFLGRGILPRIYAELSHVINVKKMVHNGIGIAFLPFSTITEDLNNKTLRLVQVHEISSLFQPVKAVFLNGPCEIRSTQKLEFISRLEAFTRI